MATKDDSSTGLMAEYALQREEFADFSLILKDGQELKCHKFMLAKVSSFFCAMLRQDCVETRTSKMKVTEFDQDTVESFLNYIYADQGLLPIGKRVQEWASRLDKVERLNVDKRDFDLRRLTPELLRMCHMYQVKNLEEKCIQYFIETIQDNNAVDIWKVAEMIDNDKLKKVALDYLWKKGETMSDVPGLKDTFHSPKLVESLVNFLGRWKTTADDEVKTFFVWTYLEDDQVLLHRKIKAKMTHTVRMMRLLIDEDLEEARAANKVTHIYKCQAGSLKNDNFCFDEDEDGFLDEEKTLAFYNLDNPMIYCRVRKLSMEWMKKMLKSELSPSEVQSAK